MGPLTSYVNDFKAWAPLYEVQGGESAKKCSGGRKFQTCSEVLNLFRGEKVPKIV